MRKALIAIGMAVFLLLVVVLGIGWYFSGKVIAVEHEHVPEVKVLSSDTSSITFASDLHVKSAGTFGIRWNGGSAFTDAIVKSDNKSVTRSLRDVKGSVPTSGKVTWDRHVWDGDPKSTLGIDYQTVNVKAERGDMPAWFVPGDSKTWVIAVHGRGAQLDSALRVLPTLQKAKTPTLVVSYCNDIGVAKCEGGRDNLGDTEWKDIDAAITYAKANGAQHVVLYGWSKGGAVVMTTLHRSPQKDTISGVILDAPVVDWGKTLEFQGNKRHLPTALIDVAEWMAEKRGHFNLDDFTQKKFANQLTVPVLIMHGETDETVPVEPAKEFAAANPGKIQLELFPNATHTAEWNADSARYDTLVSNFLAPLAS